MKYLLGASLGLTLLFLGGSPLTAALFCLFVVLWLLPTWFLVWLLLRRLSGNPELGALLSLAGVLFLTTPYWFLRKASGVPLVLFDLLAVSAAIGVFATNRRRTDFLEMVRGFFPPAERVWLGLVLPLLFCLTWLGFEVRDGGQVRYYGLFLTDFGGLSSIVSLLKASPGLPLGPVVGSGLLHYHWFYFTLPALASTFLGCGIKSSQTLILCNLLTAMLFFKVISYVVGQTCGDETDRRHAWKAIGAGLIILAPSVVYFYQTVVSYAHLPWFTLGERNHNLLTLVSSSIVFGNNTFALVLCLLGGCSLERWHQTKNVSWLAVAALCWSLVAGYSITLCFVLAATGLVALVSGILDNPMRAVAVSFLVGTGVFVGFWTIGYFETGAGQIALGLDNGHFVQNILLSFPVIGIGTALALRHGVGWLAKLLISGLFACLAVPSLLYMEGTPAGSSDFSMKTASLFIAFGGPMAVSTGRRIWLSRPRPSRLRVWILVVLIGAGLMNTAAYALQFSYYRLLAPNKRSTSISASYYDSLNFLREHTESDGVLLDGIGMGLALANPAIMIAERRVLLPSEHGEMAASAFVSEVQGTDEVKWRAWVGSGFRDATLSEYFAGVAGYLIAKGGDSYPGWDAMSRFGDVSVYRSLRKTRGSE